MNAMNAFAARAAWRRRVARTGSLIQLAFALLWIGRATLAAAGLPGRIPVGATLAATVAVVLHWLRVTLATPGHLIAGIGLVAVPAALVLVLAGPA